MPQNNSEDLLAIQDIAISFCLAVIQKRIGHIGTGKEKTLLEIRDSLIYRTWSVSWHLQQLSAQQNAITEHLHKEEPYDAIHHPQLLLNSRHLMSYIFDDVIFNLASMFDYIGNLVSLTYRGPQKSRSKWNGIINTARDKNSCLYGQAVASLLVNSHNEWVNHLLNFRGDNIHHKTELGTPKHSLKFENNTIEVQAQVYMPRSLAKKLLPNHEVEIPILKGAKLISEGSAKLCIQILKNIESTIESDYSQW